MQGRFADTGLGFPSSTRKSFHLACNEPYSLFPSSNSCSLSSDLSVIHPRKERKNNERQNVEYFFFFQVCGCGMGVWVRCGCGGGGGGWWVGGGGVRADWFKRRES